MTRRDSPRGHSRRHRHGRRRRGAATLAAHRRLRGYRWMMTMIIVARHIPLGGGPITTPVFFLALVRHYLGRIRIRIRRHRRIRHRRCPFSSSRGNAA